MLSVYPAIFIKDDLGGYSVDFPDLNYAVTQGKDMQEAMEMAVDCLAGFLYSSWRDGENVKEPSLMQDINLPCYAKDNNLDINDLFVNMVSVDVEEYAKVHFKKSVKKTLTIPAWLDEAAREKKINFSKTLQEALMAKIKA